jgi:hypothetical protein
LRKPASAYDTIDTSSTPMAIISMSMELAISDIPTAMASSSAQYSPMRSEPTSSDGSAIQMQSAVTIHERYLK